jgi:hypothetical protein
MTRQLLLSFILTFTIAITSNGQTYSFVDTSTTISFKELSIKFTRLIVPDDSNSIYINNDSSYIYADIGETILGGQIEVLKNHLSELKIEQCFETSISIYNEGPHCDLINWKHYYSPWTKLKPTKTNNYRCLNPSIKERETFVNVSVQELKNKVKESCGEHWFDLIKDIKSTKSNFVSIGISRVLIKVSGQLNGKTITKIIVIEEAMGC